MCLRLHIQFLCWCYYHAGLVCGLCSKMFFISSCKTNCLTLNCSLTVLYLHYVCNFFFNLLLQPTNAQLYHIKLYITTVSMCNLYSYMFRHCCFIIREFTTNALLSYTRFFKLQLLIIQYIKLRWFTQAYVSFQIVVVEITIL